jgi:hypothetical protein
VDHGREPLEGLSGGRIVSPVVFERILTMIANLFNSALLSVQHRIHWSFQSTNCSVRGLVFESPF